MAIRPDTAAVDAHINARLVSMLHATLGVLDDENGWHAWVERVASVYGLSSCVLQLPGATDSSAHPSAYMTAGIGCVTSGAGTPCPARVLLHNVPDGAPGSVIAGEVPRASCCVDGSTEASPRFFLMGVVANGHQTASEVLDKPSQARDKRAATVVHGAGRSHPSAMSGGVLLCRGLPFTDAEVVTLEQTLLHMRRVITLQVRAQTEREHRRALAAALDRVSVAVIVTDARGCPCAANAGGWAMLERRDGLMANEEGLQATTPTDRRHLRRALRRAGEEGLDTFVRLDRTDGARGMEVLVCGLARDSEAPGEPALLVFCADEASEPLFNTHTLQAAHGFTHAEAALAALLAQGESIGASAEAFGVCVSTARTHLRRLFEKTNTHRQGELVAVLRGGLAGLRPRPEAD